MNLHTCLRQAEAELIHAQVETPAQTARWLWLCATGMQTHQMLMALGNEAQPDDMSAFARLVQRRCAREPLQYITQEAEFCGLTFHVDERVLIPRPETELAVHTTLAQIRRQKSAGKRAVRIVDVGTGSGAIAIAVAVALDQEGDRTTAITGVDISAPALEVAEQNAKRHGVTERVRFVQGNYLMDYDAGRLGSIDIVVSNPPYIPEGQREWLQPEVARFEPPQALFAGADGLDAYRAIIRQAAVLIATDGSIVFEVGARQAGAVRDLLGALGGRARVSVLRDERGIDRVVAAEFGCEFTVR
ncbi:MAG: peptide chain release factor N(5)-glutamine methyltransferase [Bacilli bacterium]